MSEGVENLRKLMEATPEKEKELLVHERLIKLARQSPFASANEDFLNLQDHIVKERRMLIEMAKKIINDVDEKKRGDL